MKNKESKKIFGMFFAIALFVIIGAMFVNAQSYKPQKKNYCDKYLTDEQRDEIIELKKELYENGATDEEIKEAVYEKMKSYGIDYSEKYEEQSYEKKSLYSDLTEEQYNELSQMKQDLKEKGATTEEIIEAVNQKMKSYGYDIE